MSSKEDQKTRKLQEFDISGKFMAAFQRRLDKIRSDDGSNFKLEEPERKRLAEISNFGLMEGTVAGILTLLLLRRAPHSSLVKRMLQRRQPSRPAPPPPGSTNGGTPHVRNSPFDSSRVPMAPDVPGSGPGRPSSSFFYVFGWMLDVSASFFVAVSVSVAFTDSKKILKKLSTLPLLEGRSRVAEEFCPEVLTQLAQLRAQDDAYTQDLLDHPESPYLASLMEFATNCKRRQDYEKRLRRENGIGEHDPVFIPAPGVPATADAGSEDVPGDWQGQEPQFFDPSQDVENADEKWAESFVEDREANTK